MKKTILFLIALILMPVSYALGDYFNFTSLAGTVKVNGSDVCIINSGQCLSTAAGVIYTAGNGIDLAGNVITATSINGTGSSNAMNNETIANAIDNGTIVHFVNTSWVLNLFSGASGLVYDPSTGIFLATSINGTGSSNAMNNETIANAIDNGTIVHFVNTSWVLNLFSGASGLVYDPSTGIFLATSINGTGSSNAMNNETIQLMINGTRLNQTWYYEYFANLSNIMNNITISNYMDNATIIRTVNTSWITSNQNNYINANESLIEYLTIRYANITQIMNNATILHLGEQQFANVTNIANNETINNTIDNRLVTIYYNATSFSVEDGSSQGILENTQHPDGLYDSISLNFTEQADSPGLDIRINFTDGITEFNKGIMRYKMLVQFGAGAIIQLWDYEDSEWEDYPQMVQSSTFAIIEQSVFDDDSHVEDGIVQMRLYKASNGNINNKYEIDWLAISKGIGTPSGQEVDPFSIHREEAYSTFANLTQIMNNITISNYMDNATIIRTVNISWITDNQNNFINLNESISQFINISVLPPYNNSLLGLFANITNIMNNATILNVANASGLIDNLSIISPIEIKIDTTLINSTARCFDSPTDNHCIYYNGSHTIIT